MDNAKKSVELCPTDGVNYQTGYGYNLAGEMTSETYPSGKEVRTSYDGAGRVSDVSRYVSGVFDKTYASQFGYTSHGAVSDVRLGNQKWEHTSFNDRLQPTEIDLGNGPGDGSLLKLVYGYGTSNNNGNVLSQTITVGATVMAQSYGYDDLNRLTGASEGGSWSQTYAYDRYGNRAVTASTGYTLNVLTPVSLTAYNASNNRLRASQYDGAGNQYQDGSNRMFTYDGENRQLTFNTTVGQYFYDGDGRRVKKTDGTGTTVMVYDAGGQLIAEYASGGSTGSGTSYVTSDSLDSTRLVTDGSGAVKARYDYLPFGEDLGAGIGQRVGTMGYGGADSTRQKFIGKERDSESGLDFLQARYYSSAQGRFTSADPVLINDDRQIDPQQINLYHYGRNNPLRFSDPTGEDIDDSSLKDNKNYQSWKTAFLATKHGQAFWAKYSQHQYQVTIVMGPNKGGDEGAQTLPTFGENGKLNGGTIILGENFAAHNAPTGDYPIGKELTENTTDDLGHPQGAVTREARAVAILAHEFGHLEDADKMGQAAWERENDMMERNEEGVKRLRGQWPSSPEFRQLQSDCGCNNPSDFRSNREYRADGYTRGVLQDYYAKGTKHGPMPKRVGDAIKGYREKQ